MSDNVPTITWKVTNLDCYPNYDQETDVVFTVHWDCLGNLTPTTGSQSGSAFNSRVYGTTGVMYHSGSAFTPYDQLTQDQVLGWVYEAMGVAQKDSIEQSAANSIYTQINPPVISPPLPWAPVPPTFVVQPVGATIVAGSDYTFTCEATGTAPITYTWVKNNNIITGETNNTLTIVSASYNDAAAYAAIAANAGGSLVSNQAYLNVTGSI